MVDGNSIQSGMQGLHVSTMLMGIHGAFGSFTTPRMLEQEHNEGGKGT